MGIVQANLSTTLAGRLRAGDNRFFVGIVLNTFPQPNLPLYTAAAHLIHCFLNVIHIEALFERLDLLFEL